MKGKFNFSTFFTFTPINSNEFFFNCIFCYNFSYIEKITEFLQLFVTNHLKRVESCSKFPFNTFLEVLYRHTFQQYSTIPGYLRCLEVWTILLESTQSRYGEVALALGERVFQKISFKLDSRTLKTLDTEILDENVCKIQVNNALGILFYKQKIIPFLVPFFIRWMHSTFFIFQEETEWQHFLRCNIECLAKIADIAPMPIFTLLYRSWRQDLTIYGEVGGAVTNGQVILLNDNEASNVHAHLRDLASTTQALARLYTLFIGE